MKIGDVSAQLGIPASTIRYYEQVGLIEHQSRVSGRRSFNGKALYMLQFVKLAQAAGFSIVETKMLLDNYSADPNRGGLWKNLAEAKQTTIRQQIRSLEKMDKVLSKLIRCECETLEECVQASGLQPPDNTRSSHD